MNTPIRTALVGYGSVAEKNAYPADIGLSRPGFCGSGGAKRQSM